MQRLLNNYRILTFAQAQLETRSDKEFLNIGPTPYNENCTPAGNNFSDSIFECAVYIRQLIRSYGQPPPGCEFFIMKNDHEFGTYYDANIFYGVPVETDDDGALPSSTNIYDHTPEEEILRLNEDYAFNVENGLDYWDDQSKQELIEGEHHLHVAKIINIKKSA